MDEKDKTGGQAFPLVEPAIAEVAVSPGMTLRDYLAAKAMQGFLACGVVNAQEWSDKALASNAYGVADAMLEARS